MEKSSIEDDLKKREEFFEEKQLECSCRIGYVVCQNCQSYYAKTNQLGEDETE